MSCDHKQAEPSKLAVISVFLVGCHFTEKMGPYVCKPRISTSTTLVTYLVCCSLPKKLPCSIVDSQYSIVTTHREQIAGRVECDSSQISQFTFFRQDDGDGCFGRFALVRNLPYSNGRILRSICSENEFKWLMAAAAMLPSGEHVPNLGVPSYDKDLYTNKLGCWH